LDGGLFAFPSRRSGGDAARAWAGVSGRLQGQALPARAPHARLTPVLRAIEASVFSLLTRARAEACVAFD